MSKLNPPLTHLSIFSGACSPVTRSYPRSSVVYGHGLEGKEGKISRGTSLGKGSSTARSYVFGASDGGEENWAPHQRGSQDRANSPFAVSPVTAHTQVAMDGVWGITFMAAALSCKRRGEDQTSVPQRYISNLPISACSQPFLVIAMNLEHSGLF